MVSTLILEHPQTNPVYHPCMTPDNLRKCLGIAILYELLNQRDDTLAERAFSPWIDMENMMREHHIPLFALESKQPLSNFDVIGFTLPYETIYTNALNILDLANIPMRAKDRDESMPLIIAGGQAVFNPEPMHAFIDAFVIGEGEDVIHEIIDVYKAWKTASSPKADLLSDLAAVSGVYVPVHYEPIYKQNGQILEYRPLKPDLQFPVRKRLAAQLPPHFVALGQLAGCSIQ